MKTMLELQHSIQAQKKNKKKTKQTKQTKKTKKTQIFSVIMKRTGNALDKECAAFGCSSRSYCFVNKKRKLTGI